MEENRDYDERDYEEMDYDERREYRRRRRIRNQIIVYVTVAVFVVAIIVGAVWGITTVTKRISEKKQAQELAEQLEQMTQEEEAVVEPPTFVEEEEPVQEVDWLEELVNTSVESMPLEDKVAGLFVVTPEAITGVGKAVQAGEGTREALDQYAVGGLVYFGQNIIDKEQFTTMLSNTKGMAGYPVFLAVDEEGGEVSRVGDSSIEVPEVGDMAEIGAGGDTMAAYNTGATIAGYLYELGINVDFAPVTDIVTDVNASAIGERAFGSDPVLVGDMAAAMVGGMQDTGISSCLKHFPGIGSVAEDTHDGMAVLEKTTDELRASEFVAFKSGIDAGAHFVMISHASAPNVVGDNTPCSLSEEVITNLLRGELGYNGIVITDAMNMKAITEYYAADEAAIIALKAGADMILMPEDFEKAYNGVLEAVQNGTIAEERINDSLKRIYRVKFRDKVDAEGNVVEEADIAANTDMVVETSAEN